MKHLLVSILLLALFASPAASQAIYLKYSNDCMDRLEYRSGGSDATAYIAYSLPLGGQRVAMLEVGKEDSKLVRDLPGRTTACGDLTLDKARVRQINDGAIKLYVVRETSAQYHLSAVAKVALWEEYRNTLEVTSDDADFTLQTDNLVSDVNLAEPGSKMQVFLDGTLKTQCITGYIFRKKESWRADKYKEFILVPEIGVVEKRSGSGSDAAFDDRTDRSATLKLSKVDDVAYRDFLTTFCDRKQAEYYDGGADDSRPSDYEDLTSRSGSSRRSYDAVSSYDNSDRAVGRERPSLYEDLTSRGERDRPADYDDPVGQFHMVQAREGLYGISRRYGVTVSQLQDWNNLGSSTNLSVGQRLRVKPPSSSTSTPVETEKAGSTSTYKGDGYWMKAPETHVVRPGETVAKLASQYGYSEERFRKMNSLGASGQIVSGQRLRTSDCDCPSLDSSTKGAPLPYDYDQPVGRLTSYKVHEVKSGDNLFSIARKYNTTVDRIKELNSLRSDDIKVNQRLYVQ